MAEMLVVLVLAATFGAALFRVYHVLVKNVDKYRDWTDAD